MHIINRDVQRDRPMEAHPCSITSCLQDELDDMAGIRRGEQERDVASGQFFWQTEHYSHQRPHYFVSVGMFSSQNYSMEVSLNGEGLKKHHLAVGYNFIARAGEDYVDVFPAWDWQRIPGTTVVIPDPAAVRLENRRRSGARRSTLRGGLQPPAKCRKTCFPFGQITGLIGSRPGTNI